MHQHRTIPFLLFVLAVSFAFELAPEKSDPKIIIERQDSSGTILAEEARHVSLSSQASKQNVLSLRLAYPDFGSNRPEALFKRDDPPDAFREASKRYHSTRNRAFAQLLGLSSDDVFISQYSPYIFYTFKDDSMATVYDLARTLEDDAQIDSMHVFPKDIYHASSLDPEPDSEIASASTPLSLEKGLTNTVDLRDGRWDDFPAQTPFSGKNVKIGLLDSGFLNVSEARLQGAKITTLYDTYTANDEFSHPNTLATIIGGFFGLAPNAEMLYVDVNSEANFVGIERLIDAGVDVINMSVALESCFRQGDYPVNLEGYIDYLYSSTHIPMIAAAGNTLDVLDSGGYVTFPGLCANVITVGSIYKGGQPSDFSSFRIRNDVMSKPQLSAFGEARPVKGVGNVSGTSYATAAVTGAAALLIEKNGPMDMPELASVLMASADYGKIYKNADMTISLHYRDLWDIDGDGDTQELFATGTTELIDTSPRQGSGLINRFGAGALDIAKALAFDTTSQIHDRLIISNTLPMTLKTVFMTPGQSIRFAGAWERAAFVSNNHSVFRFKWRYTRSPLANYDLWLVDANGKIVASTYFSKGNSEVLRYSAQQAGSFTLKVKPRSDFRGSDGNFFDYAYVID